MWTWIYDAMRYLFFFFFIRFGLDLEKWEDWFFEKS